MSTRTGGTPGDWRIVPLAQDGSLVAQTSFQDRVFTGSPSVLALPGGRLICAFDRLGPGVRALPGTKGKLEHFNRWLQGRIFASNDRGLSWQSRGDFPFCNPCLFRDGATLYLMGHDDNLQIMKSLDGGETWSKPSAITREGGYGDIYTQSPASVLSANGHVYAIAMRIADFSYRGALACKAVPVLLRAQQNSVLTNSKSWSLHTPGKTLPDLLPPDTPSGMGTPLFSTGERGEGKPVSRGRWAYPPGWSGAHILQIPETDHLWAESSGHKFFILARAELHRTNLAALLVAREDAAGSVSFDFEQTAAGKPWAFLPLPGGHGKFDVFYDETSRLFWLVSGQSTDSMARPERLSDQRQGLPCDEANRLQIHVSRNLIDWNFAGLVTAGKRPADARTACSAAVRGSDLSIVCCGGEDASRTAADTTRITHHLIPNFRELWA
jgi:hypothetical protein